jgi:putative lipoic acid-binding regulatory protein
MGRCVDDFAQTVVSIVQKHAPDFDTGSVQMRPSSQGNYLGLTVTIRATSRAQLDALYIELSGHPLVSVVL